MSEKRLTVSGPLEKRLWEYASAAMDSTLRGASRAADERYDDAEQALLRLLLDLAAECVPMTSEEAARRTAREIIGIHEEA